MVRQKDIRKKRLYSVLAQCRLSASRWAVLGNPRWADYYHAEARRLREFGIRKIKLSVLADVFIFYPNSKDWTKTHLRSNRPEQTGIITEGMRGLIDGLLGKESRKNFRQAA